ncbi:MAG TPA: site-specific DNA-methyltransferase [Candidatus Magasanikbacteria bacterium]|nr:site-specific DNA-methyltransferase [Candidatus Magasanikbacteria bacterium]
MTKEQKFYKALQDVFIGAKIEGEGGFVNLMKIKSNYYRKIEDILKKDIEAALKSHPKFRDELFDKLYSFFSRYFTESGSIYFNSTPFHNNIYEKVYTDEKDVILFWKTQMLYYVKTDRIFRSLPVEFDGFKFYFDASKIENKKANEKRSLIFDLSNVREDGTIVFGVQYSERGAKTKQDEILKAIKRKGIAITEEQLERAFKVFEKQSEIDFFINKNAKAFLQEQFKLWSYQYFWEGAKEWSADRVNQLQILKDIAFKIIDFISQFEDELVKIWNKPKFVKNSNYVVTLDRLNNIELVKKILKHKGINEQIKEWQELSIVDENFKKEEVIEKDLTGEHLSQKYQHLPIDTKYFKDLELEILSQFEDLDKSLDGWLIKSENYQAMTTILPKFKELGQTIYIDPPFNTGNDFIFLDNFQDSTWLSLINDRLKLAKLLLNDKGNLYLHLDHLAEHYSKILLDKVFGPENFKAKITWNTGENISGFKSQALNWIRQADFIHYYTKTDKNIFYKAFEPLNKKDGIGWLDFIGKKSNEIFIEKWKNGKYIKEMVDKRVKAKGTIWNDIYSFQYSEPRITESLSFVSNQKPENLIRRIIQTSSEIGGFVFDFFAGSGTTCAVAQKLNRKWVGIEMGDYFKEIYLDETEIKKTAGESDEDEENIGLDNPAIVKIISETEKTAKVIIKKVGLLGRMKIVLNGDKEFKAIHSPVIRKPHLSKDVNWQGGGFFKYYELEQYEEALGNCKYEDGDLFTVPGRSPYQEYVFMKDEKMLKALEIDYKQEKVKVDLSKLYPNIDIAETLSNLTGKWIKKISYGEVEFEDGTRINTKDLDYKLIKPLIWW